MRQKGVSTIVCLCHVIAWLELGGAATSNGYFPEWLIGTYDLLDYNYHVGLLGPREQRSQAMGLTFQPRQLRITDKAAYWAEAEADPASAESRDTGQEAAYVDWAYRSLLILASGMQMAGPHLTPQSFERGLQRTVFPNPDHPIKAGRVGFLEGDHSMTDDVAEYWWSNTDRGPYSDDAGTICYVDHGDRRTPGHFPVGDEPFFKPPCDSGA